MRLSRFPSKNRAFIKFLWMEACGRAGGAAPRADRPLTHDHSSHSFTRPATSQPAAVWLVNSDEASGANSYGHTLGQEAEEG